MKRIKLRKEIHHIIDTTYLMETNFFKYKDNLIGKIIKLIGNNYRRRQHHPKGYACHCGKFHKVMKLCTKKES